MSKNKLIRSSCKNSGKNRGNKTQKILKRDFLNVKKWGFRYLELKNHNSDRLQILGNHSLGAHLQIWCRDFFYFALKDL